MSDVLEVQERLGRLFERAFRIEDIAESLASFDAERPAADVLASMRRRRYRVAGVRDDGGILGYVSAEDLDADGVERCGDVRRDFTEEEIISGDASLAEGIRRLAGRDGLFVRVLGRVNGIVTWSDVQKPPMRMWLFGVITLIEMAFTSVLETLFTDDAWADYLSPSRRAKALDFQRERARRRADHGLRLVDCIQFSDKGQIIAKDEMARRVVGFASRKQGEAAVKRIVSLRDKLAHSQDIVTDDADSIVEIARQIERILRIGSVFQDVKRSTPRPS